MAGPHARGIPPVHRFLSDERIARFEPLAGRESVKQAVAAVLDRIRGAPNGAPSSYEALAQAVVEQLRLVQSRSLVPVINGTGIILHTNLGRAPLARGALRELAAASCGYANLEYDLEAGARGSRYEHASAAICALTGAEDALVVNNCAAAVLLIAATFAKGREVVVSRGELIEIGGGFRLPDVLQSSGAALVEAGTTNKTYVEDFEAALTPRTGLLLRSHTSNYRISGFVHAADPKELAALGRRTGIPVAEDLGSGALCDLREYGLPRERTVQDALSDGIDLVAFSGDKLPGGPQSGIIVGRAAFVARLRANPLVRALRIDKMTLAALNQTMRLHLSTQTRREIPLYAMLSATRDELRIRAGRYVPALPRAEIVESVAYAGGGSLPEQALPSIALAFAAGNPERAAAALRSGTPPLVARIEDGRLLIDLRTILPEEDERAAQALAHLQ